MQEVRDQPIGPYFGYQCDEVTDASNWEQLGVVIRYVVNGKPIERLIEFIECEEITRMQICESIISCMNAVGLDPNLCRSQTMDGAGNMSGKHSGCAARFKDQYPKAVYHYCSCHDLNLAISKSCLDTLKKQGIFFKYSPKRTRRLERAVDEINDERTENKIDKKKFKVFSEETHHPANISRDVAANFALFRSNFVERKKLGCKGGCGSKWSLSKIVRFTIYCLLSNHPEFLWIHVWT